MSKTEDNEFGLRFEPFDPASIHEACTNWQKCEDAEANHLKEEIRTRLPFLGQFRMTVSVSSDSFWSVKVVDEKNRARLTFDIHSEIGTLVNLKALQTDDYRELGKLYRARKALSSKSAGDSRMDAGRKITQPERASSLDRGRAASPKRPESPPSTDPVDQFLRRSRHRDNLAQRIGARTALSLMSLDAIDEFLSPSVSMYPKAKQEAEQMRARSTGDSPRSPEPNFLFKDPSHVDSLMFSGADFLATPMN